MSWFRIKYVFIGFDEDRGSQTALRFQNKPTQNFTEINCLSMKHNGKIPTKKRNFAIVFNNKILYHK